MNKESWSDFEKYLIQRIDELHTAFSDHKQFQENKLSKHELEQEKRFSKLKFKVYTALIVLAGGIESGKWVIEFIKSSF